MIKRVIYLILLCVPALAGHAQVHNTWAPDCVTIDAEFLVDLHHARISEICDNGIDDDGDGYIDCADGDCEVLVNGGFEDVPTSTVPNSSVTFPPYPNFLGSWAAVNIDGEVFYKSSERPSFEGNRYASLLQNAGGNFRLPWNETSWGAGGYDRFLYIANTFPGENYNISFYHAGDDRYNYLPDQTLVQVQSLDTDYYYDTLIATPDVFDWTAANVSFNTDEATHSVAILFSTKSPNNSSVVLDALQFCGPVVATMRAEDDIVSTPMNTGTGIAVLANDLNLPVGGINLQTSAGPPHGSIAIQPDGTIDYTPDAGFVGVDSFRYIICDPGSFPLVCASAWVYIHVTGEAPVALDDYDTTFHDLPLFVRVLENDSDPDNGLDLSSLYVSPEFSPAFGNLELIAPGEFLYTPDPGFTGDDAFTYTICDNSEPEGLCSQATAYIHVISKQPKVSVDTFYLETPEETELLICSADYFEFENIPTDVYACGTPGSGTFSEAGFPCYSYIPEPGFSGTVEACITWCDVDVCDTSIFIIEVLPVNDAPVAVDDYRMLPEETSVAVDVTLNDTDADDELSPADVIITKNPVHGAASLDPVLGIIYEPYTMYRGMDTITYQVCDGGVPPACDRAIVVLDVYPVPDTVEIVVDEDATVLLCAEHDIPGGMPGTYNVQYAAFSDGQQTTMSDDCIPFSPPADYNGDDIAWLTGCRNGVCDTLVCLIKVLPVNDPPVAENDERESQDGEAVLVAVLDNDYDPDMNGGLDITSLLLTREPDHGFAVIRVDGTVEYIPDPGFSGRDEFAYEVCDLGTPMPALCDEAVVTIDVAGSEEISCFIPEAFSPNADNLYDYFAIECAEYYPELELFIYDRYGNMIFRSEPGYQNNWDGTDARTNSPLREGTYYYVARFNDPDTKDRAGHVLIWR